MGITLNWSLQAGLGLDKIVVYRSTSKINTGALPAQLIELPGDATTFTDTTVVSGSVYYYVVSLVKGAQISFSSNYEMAYFPHYGPGPQQILRGTWEKGYFGIVPDDEMFTYTDFGLQAGLAISGAAGGWHKFIINGKVLFWPANPASISYQALYAAGAVFGDGTVGQYPAGCTAPTGVIQNRKVTRDGYEFTCRVPRSSQHTSYIINASGFVNSELFELLTLVYGVVGAAVVAGKERFADYSTPNNYLITTAMYSSSQTSMPYLDGGSVTYGAFTNPYPYRPVLELVW